MIRVRISPRDGNIGDDPREVEFEPIPAAEPVREDPIPAQPEPQEVPG